MNILYHFRTRGTGAEAVHISGIARAFEKLGHKITFSSPTGIDPRTSAGASPFKAAGKESFVSRLARNCPRFVFELLEIGYNLSALLRNRRILAGNTFGLIYERHAFFLFTTAWLAKGRGIPLAVEVNELAGDKRIREQPIFASFARWCDRFTFLRAKAIVVVSPHLKRRIEELGIDGGKILVLPNAVDEDDCREPAKGETFRATWNAGNCLLVGFVGWFVEWHRLDMLITAFAQACEGCTAVRLVLVGDGPLEASLSKIASRRNVSDKLVFGGVVGHADMPACVAAMDVCVVPHSNEYRSPIKMFEYMAQARLVIAARTEPIEMVIRHGENGLLFEPEHEESMLAALKLALEDAQLRERLGKQARLDVLAKHTWLINAQAVLLMATK